MLLALTLCVAGWRLRVLAVEDLWFDEVFSAVLACSFLLTWALCEVVSRVPWLRPLFGMKRDACTSPTLSLQRSGAGHPA